MKTGRDTAFGTREWAECNVNCLIGCSHNCRYCYAKAMAIRFKRMTAAEWENEQPIKNMKGYRKRNGWIMFPSSHDITPRHADLCVERLTAILKAGNNVLVVSKPHYDVIRTLCGALLHYRDHIIFRFTIGSADDSVLGFWEPGAPGYDERLACLKYAFQVGFVTSVSIEPMLDNNVEKVVESVLPYVTDTIWLGKMQDAISRLRINMAGEEAISKARNLLLQHHDGRIHDLYKKYQHVPQIMWKDSLKVVLKI